MNEDRPTRPAFSALERRLDPSLDAVETNPLYDAFRRRRTLHGGGPFDWQGIWRSLKSLIDWRQAGPRVLPVVVGIMAAVAISNFTGWEFSIVFVIAIAWAISAALSGSGKDGSVGVVRLPNRLGGIFSVNRTKGRGETDVWMTGASGEDVLEALYLEGREGNFAISIVLFFGIGGAACLIYFLVLRELRVGGVLMSGAILFLSWRLALWSFLGMGGMRWQAMARLSEFWRSAAQKTTLLILWWKLQRFWNALVRLTACAAFWQRVGVKFIRGLFQALRAMVVVGLICAFVGLLVLSAADRSAATGRFLPAGAHLVINAVGYETLIAVALMVVALAIPHGFDSTRGAAQKMRGKTLLTANRHYNLYMAMVIMQDEDGLIWVDDVYPQDRRATLTGRMELFLERANNADDASRG